MQFIDTLHHAEFWRQPSLPPSTFTFYRSLYDVKEPITSEKNVISKNSPSFCEVQTPITLTGYSSGICRQGLMYSVLLVNFFIFLFFFFALLYDLYLVQASLNLSHANAPSPLHNQEGSSVFRVGCCRIADACSNWSCCCC